jgi:DNA-binding IclR family transcriptional regulator
VSDPMTHSVPAVERAVSILDMIAKSKGGLTVSQLARGLGFPKSSAHRIVLTFERCGFLHLDKESGRYRLGLRLFGLANMALNGISLREQAAPFLHQLMEKTGLTVHMAVFEHDEAVLIEKVQPPGFMKLATWVGKRVDLHCTALGKVLLAYRPEPEIDDLIKRHGLLRHNDNTIGSAGKLKENLALVVKLGYAIDDEEEEIGIRCIGVPIFESESKVVAAISVSGTTDQIRPESLAALAEELKRAAKEISEQIGDLAETAAFSQEAGL